MRLLKNRVLKEIFGLKVRGNRGVKKTAQWGAS